MSVFVHPDGYYQVTSLQDIVNVKPGSLMANAWRGMNERRQLVGRKPLRYEGTAITEVDDIGAAVIVPGAVLQNAGFWQAFGDRSAFSPILTNPHRMARPPVDGVSYQGESLVGTGAGINNFTNALNAVPDGLFLPGATTAGDVIGAALVNSVLWQLWVYRNVQTIVNASGIRIKSANRGSSDPCSSVAASVANAYLANNSTLPDAFRRFYLVGAQLATRTSTVTGIGQTRADRLVYTPPETATETAVYIVPSIDGAESNFVSVVPGTSNRRLFRIDPATWPEPLLPSLNTTPYQILGVNCNAPGDKAFDISDVLAINTVPFSDLPP